MNRDNPGCFDLRQKDGWNVDFCMQHFGIPPGVVNIMSTETGPKILWQLWQDYGDQLYESRLYLLREELYRTYGELALSHASVAKDFFSSLPPDGIVLDYGCGTAEYGRQWWYDRGGRADLYDVSELLVVYLSKKYREQDGICLLHNSKYIDQSEYDSLLCLDVLEHLSDPIGVTENVLYPSLKPGAQALIFFCAQPGIPGHLDASIALYPAWLEWMREHFNIVKEVDGLLWVQKI